MLVLEVIGFSNGKERKEGRKKERKREREC